MNTNETATINKLSTDIFTAAVMGTQAFKDGKGMVAGSNLELMEIVYTYRTDSHYDHKCRCEIMKTYTNNWILARRAANNEL